MDQLSPGTVAALAGVLAAAYYAFAPTKPKNQPSTLLADLEQSARVKAQSKIEEQLGERYASRVLADLAGLAQSQAPAKN